ncbi:MAG: hypothetical protein GY913_09630 [Proteobacteria bacterium]|nr:hypothetical protein [Pseudomonadota bacterium]MCP4917171.1 hypothetical protein [Pseudomonadota bacterium]
MNRFHVSLGLCSTLCIGFAIHAFTSVDTDASTVQLPTHVTRLAFGVDEWPEPEEPGCFEELVLEDVPEPAPRHTVRLADVAFVGEGDWELGATLIRRRVSDLRVCYDDETLERVEVTIDTWGDPRVAGVSDERASCLSERLGDWPWPQELSGRMVMSLQVGTLI